MNKAINPPMNDLIFRELLKRGYAVKGDKKVWDISDSKLWYLTPQQAQSFLDLESSTDYQKDVIQVEINLIKENVEDMMGMLGNEAVNIIDLGCGDGKKAVLFIESLKNKVDFRYCPVDISGFMVERAIDNIKKLNVGEVVDFQWNISDFENLENISLILRHGKFKKNLILLLGNTLGNFEINDLLYEIRSSMSSGDVLLIGNGLDNRKEEEILKSYSNSKVNDFLIHIMKQVGLKQEDLEFGARFKNSRVELFYTFKKENKISFHEREIEFDVGDEIVVALSYKYDRDDFMSYLQMYFDEVQMKVSEDNGYALAFCRKT